MWSKDNASNVSATAETVQITFDNETPVLTSFSLQDPGTSSYNYSNVATVNVPLDNLTASDAGEGIVAYFFTDNASLTPGPDNVTWLTDNSSMNVTFDNGTNESKTVYGYAKDRAGQVSSAANASIVFDNSTPIINSAADNGSGVVNFKSGTVGLVLSLMTMTLLITSSGFKTLFFTFGVDNSSGSAKIAPATPSSSDWVSIVILGSDKLASPSVVRTILILSHTPAQKRL